MKPIVEPGIKSVNATVTVTSIAAQCKYWNETASSWSEDGCRVRKLHPSHTVAALLHHLKALTFVFSAGRPPHNAFGHPVSL